MERVRIDVELPPVAAQALKQMAQILSHECGSGKPIRRVYWMCQVSRGEGWHMCSGLPFAMQVDDEEITGRDSLKEIAFVTTFCAEVGRLQIVQYAAAMGMDPHIPHDQKEMIPMMLNQAWLGGAGMAFRAMYEALARGDCMSCDDFSFDEVMEDAERRRREKGDSG